MSHRRKHNGHPLHHKGVSQPERYPKALMPESFRLDERSIQDLLVAAYEYAKLLNFHEPNTDNQGDWTCFWYSEGLAYLAILAAMDIMEWQTGYADIEIDFAQELAKYKDPDDDACVVDPTSQYLLKLIRYLVDMAKTIDEHWKKLPDNLPLKMEIETLIKKDNVRDLEELEGTLSELIAYHKATDLNLDHTEYANFYSNAWGLPNRDAYDLIKPVDDVDRERLRGIFIIFYRVLEKIKMRAQYGFDQAMNAPEAKQPHVALFLAFLQLFRHAQEGLNDLTYRHLDHYYEKVLCLHRGKEQPDEAYLIFELAKGFHQHLIEKGTKVLAGKDADRKPLLYEAIEDWVVSRAKVSQLKNTYIHTDSAQVYAASMANSADGKSEPFGALPVRWRSMGDGFTRLVQGEQPNYFNGFPKGDIGFAIASPQLILKEGRRIIDISVHIENTVSDLVANDFTIRLSGEEDWILLDFNEEIPNKDASENSIEGTASGFNFIHHKDGEGGTQLRFRMVLQADDPAVVFPGEKFPFPKISTRWPFVQILLNNKTETIRYAALRETRIQEIEIKVKVQGIREHLILQNDFGVFDGTQKFFPFGQVPAYGSKFYLGSTEAFQKQLDEISIQLDWIDDPDFSDYFENYSPTPANSFPPDLRVDFLTDSVLPSRKLHAASTLTGTIVLNGEPISPATVQIDESKISTTTSDGNFSIDAPAGSEFIIVHDNDDFRTVKVPITSGGPINLSIYSGTDEVAQTHVVEDSRASLVPAIENDMLIARHDFHLSSADFERDIRQQSFTEYSPEVIRGFVRFSLIGDFRHKDYTNSLILQAARVADNPDGAGDILPNAPYSPATNGLSLNYTSTQTMEEGIDGFYHILPFEGYNKVALKNLEAGPSSPLVDPYVQPTWDDTVALAQGNLYIGLEDLTPGATVSLLVQVMEGSERNPEALPPKVQWSYMASEEKEGKILYNIWQPFAHTDILKDQTIGLTRSGIIQFNTATDFTKTNTLLDDTLFWIRASVVEDRLNDSLISIAALPDLVDIRAQALQVRFGNDDNELGHLSQPLPAGTLSKLFISQSQIKKIEQPFASFNGKLPENGTDFYRRVSERLRHKDRAICIWDYERSLLEKFPKVFKAKCISHTAKDVEPRYTDEAAPGHVMLAVIPDLRHRNAVLRSEPRFSFGDLEEVARYLRSKTTLFVSFEEYLRVVNPLYEPLRVSLKVKFHRGVDAEYHRFELDQAIQQYLAPWINDEQAPIDFERPISKSQLLHFLENLSYVDVVGQLKVYHGYSQTELTQPNDGNLNEGELIRPYTARSVLTTYDNPGIPKNETNHLIEVMEEEEAALCSAMNESKETAKYKK